MKHSLSILLMTAALASASAQDVPATPDSAIGAAVLSGASLIHRAAQQLAQQESIQADLRQRIDLFGQSLVGSGTYLQKTSPRGLLVRLDWKVPVADRLATTQQICDGRFLWIRRDLLDGSVLQRVDLDRVRNALDRDAADGRHPASWERVAIVGLPRLLDSLADHFQFDAPRTAQLGELPVWVVDGVWKPRVSSNSAVRAGVNPVPDAAGRMSHLPTHVRVVVDRTDLMLQRIEYLRSGGDDRARNKDGQAVGLQVLAAFDVVGLSSGLTLEDGLFVCETGRQEIADHTDRYLRSLKIPEAP